jgi:2-phospho-L-lactate guanylyltransferase (CobY/MobA/RfbA family)
MHVALFLAECLLRGSTQSVSVAPPRLGGTCGLVIFGLALEVSFVFIFFPISSMIFMLAF